MLRFAAIIEAFKSSLCSPALLVASFTVHLTCLNAFRRFRLKKFQSDDAKETTLEVEFAHF